MLQTTPPTSSGMPQAIVLPASSINLNMSTVNNNNKQQQQQQAKKMLQLPHHRPVTAANLQGSLAAAVSEKIQAYRNGLGPGGAPNTKGSEVIGGGAGAATAGSKVASALAASQLTSKLRMVLLKCFGPVSESVVNQHQLVVSNFLQDIYKQSYFTTSNCADLPLSPESCCLLTICYLSSLQRGERISVENLRTMIHYAQLGELDWLHYYKKHKKMSESTFVQAQLIHLSRVAVYPVLGKVRIVISNQSLSEGILTTLQNMAQLLNSHEQILPEYWVVLAVRPSSTIDFCVLAVDPLQVQLLYEMKLLSLSAKSKKQSRVPASGGSGKVSNPVTKASALPVHSGTPESDSGSKIFLSKELLLQVQSFQRELGGDVLLPFSQPGCNQDNLQAGLGLLKVKRSEADTISPSFSHLVEHRPRGPFQDQYNVAMHMVQKVLSNWGTQTKIEDYRKLDFRVLCPAEASFVSQTVSDILESGLLDYLKSGWKDSDAKDAPRTGDDEREGGEGVNGLSRSREVESRVVCCGSEKDLPRFRALLAELEANKDTLYVVIAEDSHITNSMVAGKTEQSSNLNAFYSDNTKLLCYFPNCVIVNVSSFPYTLQTNRSFISFSNEIHWPIGQDKSGLHFCSTGDFKTNQFQNLESEFEYGVRFRDDQCFEEMFHEAVTNMGSRYVCVC